MLERIDRMFISNAWDAISSCLDHSPLLLCMDSVHHAKKRFHFRLLWVRMPGVSPQRSHSIDLHLLDLPRCELLELSACFMEQEVWQVIRAMPPYKALGPDGFMPRFFQATWDIIKLETMSAFNAFWYLGTRYFQEINGTLLVLLSKKPDASMIKNL
jgi:hypothetical protein